MKDEMMAKIMDEVMKKMGGTEAPAQSMACAVPVSAPDAKSCCN